MDLLKVASANATEIIGKGLIDALSALSRDNSIDQAANSMNSFANAIANTTKGMGELIGQVKQIIDSDVGKFLLAITALLTLGKKQLILGTAGLIAYDIGKTQTPSSNFTYGAGNPRADIILSKNLTKARKEEYAIIQASNKSRTELDKLKDKFDVERIGLMTALNAATDEETKLRIRAQLAILDNNEALAKKYNAELEGATAAKALADASYQAAGALTSFGPALFNALGEMTARGRNQIAPLEGGSMTYNVPQGAVNQAAQAPAVATPSVGVTVNAGTIVTDQQLEAVIQQNVLQLLKSGNKLLPAGSL